MLSYNPKTNHTEPPPHGNYLLPVNCNSSTTAKKQYQEELELVRRKTKNKKKTKQNNTKQNKVTDIILQGMQRLDVGSEGASVSKVFSQSQQ